MSTVRETNPVGKGGDKDKQNDGEDGQQGERELMIPLSELRATVSQLLKEAGAAQDKQQGPRGSKSQPGKCQCRLSVDCVAELNRLHRWRDPHNSFNLNDWRRASH